jgi:hypothetical protein
MQRACSGCAVGCRTRENLDVVDFDRQGLTLAAWLCFGLPMLALLLGASLADWLIPQFPAAALLGLIAVAGMISRLTAQVEAWLTPKS